MNEALRLGLKDVSVLEEIGDLFEQQDFFPEAQRLYEACSALILMEQQKASAEHEAKRSKTLSQEKKERLTQNEQKVLKLLDEKNGKILQKLGNTLCNDKYDNGSQVELAIECLKKSIELVNGESNKTNIALTLQTLLQRVNRAFEIAPYKAYLPDGNQSENGLE